MRGKHKVIVKNNRLHYEFEIKRNISIIKGDSATGKTTLIDMIRQVQTLGNASGIELSCDVPCRVLEGNDWKIILANTNGHIIFIDEENSFINTEEFAKEVENSDNYFVLITRESLYNLPYSVEEIYGLKSSGKYQNTSRIYQSMYQIYSAKNEIPVTPRRLITEDSKSGYQFFKQICDDNNISCESAEGKSKIFKLLKSKKASEEICVVADGAAFGPEMDKTYDLVRLNENIKLYLPESFEWLILKSGIIGGNTVKDILNHPEDFIESQEFFSWERYFEKLLIDNTVDTYMQYTKTKLPEAYSHEKNKDAILAVVADGNIRLNGI